MKVWRDILYNEIQNSYFRKIISIIKKKKSIGTIIYPPFKEIFNAFYLTKFDSIKVVILGQDPYYKYNQAHGLSFSVNPNIPLPPSLINIFKELNNDINSPFPKNGCLIKWATQGVLLLNTILTVESGKPLSHYYLGWEKFTDKVIISVNNYLNGVVFLLWGKYAQKKSKLINLKRHYILTASHPSPLSANNGFFGCRHFSKTNIILKQQGKKEIKWVF